MTGKPFRLRIAELVTIAQLRERVYLDEDFDVRWAATRWYNNVGHNAGDLAGHEYCANRKLGTRYKKMAYTLPGVDSAGRHNQVGLPIHHAVWALHHGKWAQAQIDHKDGNGLNNHIDNLREATSSEQMSNKPIQTNNTSGHTGVFHLPKAKGHQKWYGVVKKHGKTKSKGFYDKEPAIEWVKATRLALHGEFAQDNRKLEASC
jgi:hypothetical protein